MEIMFVYYRKEERIRTSVFIYVLSLQISIIMEKFTSIAIDGIRKVHIHSLVY